MSEEQTILELVVRLEVGLKGLENELYKVLKRGVEKGSESGARPENPSIVSEIIDILHGNNKRLEELTTLIMDEILTRLASHQQK